MSQHIVDQVREQLEKIVQANQTWYVLSKKWFDLFLKQDNVPEIDNSDILHTSEEYIGYKQIKPNLTCDEDYILICEEGWNILLTEYGISNFNQIINRGTIATSEYNAIVEIYQKPLNAVCIEGQEISYKKCYATKVATIENIVKTFYQINNFKFWKCQVGLDHTKVESLMKEGLESNSSKFQIPGNLVADINQTLEEAQIADEDVVVIEVQEKVEENAEEEKIVIQELQKCLTCEQNYQIYECRKCQEKHWCSEMCAGDDKKHKCIKQKQQQYQEQQKVVSGSGGLMGLQNLGNTCFMNSGTQCLLHTTPLIEFFLSTDWQNDINRSNALGTGGRLAEKFAGLVNQSVRSNHGYFSPWEFKQVLSKFAPQFTGYNQHDSQELINFVLDGLHEDLNRIIKKPYIEGKESDGRSDDIVSAECWDRHKKRNDSKIVDLFHGQYKSTLVCPKCERISVIFDPFEVLSIEIPSKEVRRFQVTYVSLNLQEPAQQFSFLMPVKNKVRDLQDAISEKVNNPNLVLISTQGGYQSQDNLMILSQSLADNQSKNIFAYELSTVNEAVYRTILDFSKSYQSTQYYTYHSKIGLSRIVDIPKQMNTGDLYKFFYKQYEFMLKPEMQNFEERFKELLHGEQKFRNDFFRLRLEAETNPYSIILKMNGIQVERKGNQNYYSSYYRQCKFCGSEQCRDGCLIKYNEQDTIAKFLESSHFKIKLQFNSSISNLEQHINKINQEELKEPMHQQSDKSVNLYDCLKYFHQTEVLEEDNMWYCNRCKEHVQATKTLQLYKMPQILIIHLKRFKQRGYFRTKNDKNVDYPVEGLDLNDFLPNAQEVPPIYDLYAVSIHMGGMGGGHYVAYAKNHGKWHSFNDSSVGSCGNPKTQGAYVLFYQRRS